ncbi:MAG TPA: restriction endonuclease [Caulobacteraceae bacterium]
MPTYEAYLWPIVEQLRAHGSSMTIEEMVDSVGTAMNLTDAQREAPHGATGRTEVDYRLAWARTYLKKAQVLENSERGVWRLTSKGLIVSAEDVAKIPRQVHKAAALARKAKSPEVSARDAADTTSTTSEDETSWVDQLLSVLLTMPPPAFERLCQRVLRESGFVKVEVTGRSGDGGIDGTGVLRVNLLSFHVLFQCKRYAGSVGAGVVRDFRGAMVGRADKGLIITTGNFSADARREAVRDGAPAIDLIDGTALCGLLKDLRIGVEVQMVEAVTINAPAFGTL